MKILDLLQATALAAVVAAIPLTAAELRVVNENKQELNIKLIPESAATKSLHFTRCNIKPESYISLKVAPKNVSFKEYFSIQGDTNWTKIRNDTCKRLNVHKDYRVTFQNNTIGTTCIAEKIKAYNHKKTDK